VVGLYVGPQLRAAYEFVFSEPSCIEGDYDAIYDFAGKNVVLFSTSTCPYCRDERAYLDAHNVRYKDFVVDTSVDAQKRFDSVGGGGVPLLFVGNRRIRGFQEDVLNDSIKNGDSTSR
jgi:mycoredoxin